jgi:hypothetical protein
LERLFAVANRRDNEAFVCESQFNDLLNRDRIICEKKFAHLTPTTAALSYLSGDECHKPRRLRIASPQSKPNTHADCESNKKSGVSNQKTGVRMKKQRELCSSSTRPRSCSYSVS